MPTPERGTNPGLRGTLAPVSFRPESIRGTDSRAGGGGAGGGGAGGSSGTSGPGQIDFRLVRRHTVAEFHRGRLSRLEVCDAHPELLRAATNVGRRTEERCPICEESPLVLVTFAFGARLPAHGRCITDAAEMARLSRRREESTCYVVEVCPACRWNHLARTFFLGARRAAG